MESVRASLLKPRRGARPRRGAHLALCLAILLAAIVMPRISLADTLDPLESASPRSVRARETFAEVASSFTENRGQAADGIRYYLRGNPSVLLRDDGIEIVLRPRDTDVPAPEGSSFVIRFDRANPVRPIGVGELTARSNFFLGSDPGRWTTNVPSYEGILYPSIYDGVDAFFTPSKSGVKYEFRVGVGARPESIVLSYEGASPTIDRDGGLTIATTAGEVRDSVPVSTQGQTEVPCEFVHRGPQSVGFACADLDGSLPLVIDPLLYSTYFGDGCQDEARGVAHDGAGHPIVLGWTYCSVPTTSGAYDTSFGGHYDVFIAKFDTVARRLIFSTYLGGRGGEYGTGIEVDAHGNIYVAGQTYSMDFPTTPGATIERNRGITTSTDTSRNSIPRGAPCCTRRCSAAVP